MVNFAEVLTENQSKNMNRICSEIEKQLNSFNEDVSAYKANRNSGVATISVNPNMKSTGAATINVNRARHTWRVNTSGEEDKNSDSGQGETDIRKAKRKRLSSKCQKSKTDVRDTDEHRSPPEEDELSLYDGSDLDDQIEKLIDTSHIANAKEVRINEEDEDSDEDDLIKDIENGFNSVEQTGEPIGSNLAKIITNVIRTPANTEKLVKKLKSLPRPENLDSLKVKKCNIEMWSKMLQSETRFNDLKS